MVVELILLGLLVPLLGYAFLRWGNRLRGSAKATGSAFRKKVGLPSTIEAVIDTVVLCVIAYFIGGMAWVHRINDDMSFGVSADSVPAQASLSVATASALVDREINDTNWPANDPVFMPGWFLDNMPSYQKGIITAISRFIVALTDRVTRPDGVVPVDTDLQMALGLLMYSGNVWIFDPSQSWAPTVPSEEQYNGALAALKNYSRRLAEGEAVFRRDANSLIAVVDTVAADVVGASGAIYQHVRLHSGDFLIDALADNMFFENKGRLYAYYLILRDLETDYDAAISERRLSALWQRMVSTIEKAMLIDPWVVANGRPDGQIFPNHLVAQDFYLSRVAVQLHQISEKLKL